MPINEKLYKEILPEKSISVSKYLGFLVTYRRLLFLLSYKDVRVKYSQSVFGILWSFFQPVAGLFLFSFFFGRLLNVGTLDTPFYPLFVFPGMLGWYFFSVIAATSGGSIIESQGVIKKTYFPKILLPVSKAVAAIPELIAWIIILIVMLIFYGHIPSFKIILLPVFIFLNFIAGLTVGMIICTFTTRYRDVLHVVPYLAGFTIFVTPVFYPKILIPQALHQFIFLNPIAAIVDGYRWCLFPSMNYPVFYMEGIFLLLCAFFVMLIFFKKREGTFANDI